MDITIGCSLGVNKIYNIHKKQPVGLYGKLDNTIELNRMTYGWECQNQEDFIFYGYNNGSLKYFNNKEKQLIGELNYESSIQSINPLKNDKLLVALNNGFIDVKTFSDPFNKLEPINLPILNKKKQKQPAAASNKNNNNNNKNHEVIEPVNTQSFKLNVSSNIGGFTMNSNKDKFAFGGNGVNLTIYDLETQTKTYTAKFKHDFLNLQEPVNIFDLKYMSNDDKIIIGSTNKLKGYDLRSKNNRDSFLDVSFSKHPIQCVQFSQQREFYIYASDSMGKLFCYDIRTGRHCGSFKDSVGSIRDIQIHPTLPLLATVGLDRFLRVYNLDNRKMLQKVFLKQRLSCILFSKEEPNLNEEDEEIWNNLEENNKIQVKEEDGAKRSSISVKVTDNMDSDDEIDSDDNNGFDDDDDDDDDDDMDSDGLDGSDEDISEFNIKDSDDEDSDDDNSNNKKKGGNNKKKIIKKPINRKPSTSQPKKKSTSQVLKKKLSGLRKSKK